MISRQQGAEKDRTGARQAGFSLVEMMVVMVLMGVVVSMVVPGINRWMARQRFLLYAQELMQVASLARQTAVRHGVPVVAELQDDELVVWVNVDNDDAITYSPSANEDRTADYILVTKPLPEGDRVAWGGIDGPGNGNGPSQNGPGNGNGGGGNGGGGNGGGGNGGGGGKTDFDAAVSGFTTQADGSVAAIFKSDGSIEDPGAFRIRNSDGHVLEIRIAPMATARASLRKYEAEPWWGGEAGFVEKGRDSDSGKAYWTW